MTKTPPPDWGPLPPRGAIVRLRPQLVIPGGRYKVLSSRGDTIKLRQGSKNPIELKIARFKELIVEVSDVGETE